MKELLGKFEELRREHEDMDAAEFNDDGNYKAGIIQVANRTRSYFQAVQAGGASVAY